MYLGLDGYKKGWVCVTIDERGGSHVDFLRDIQELNQRSYEMAMIDIPIGLPEADKRQCDLCAREILKVDRNRVFTGARRPLLDHCCDYDEANSLGRKLEVGGKAGDGVSKQLFCILKKIKEVDAFLSPDRQNYLRECHPELVFRRLKGDPVPNKHTPGGLEVRRNLLKPYFTGLDELIEKRIGKGAKEDDVLDACACAIAARDCATGKNNVVPRKPVPCDGKKLKMQIWY
jgi:predicted RNase H-like nuclease